MIDTDLSEIRRAFAIEGVELLAEMETALLVLESAPENTEEFNRLFRAIHTIKGSAGIVMFTAAETLCHEIEHKLVTIRDGCAMVDHALVVLLLNCHDHLAALMNSFAASGGTNQVETSVADELLLLRLQQWVPTATTQIEKRVNNVPCLEKDSNVVQAPDNGHSQTLFPESIPAILSLPTDQRKNKSDKHTYMRVEAQKIDQLSDLAVELVTAASILEAAVRQSGDHAAREAVQHIGELIKHAQEKTMALRMVPVATLFKRFQRVVHDIGAAAGKQIQLVTEGQETELDKAVAEKLYEPLLHLIRNAIDHGIESADQRVAAGKSPIGTVLLKAVNESGNIVIRIGDDGQGINLEVVADKARSRGLLQGNGPLLAHQLLNVLFEPGFSTIEDATLLSGRGVGMEVVKKFVDAHRGQIEVTTEKTEGTTFHLTLPLSLSLIDGFLLAVGQTLFILPMDRIQETMELPISDHRSIMPHGCLQVRENLFPCRDLREILGLEDDAPEVRYVVVVRANDNRVCLIVDRLLGELKTAIKPLGRIFAGATCVSGVAILGDGTIAFYLEAEKIIDTRDKSRQLS